MRKCDSCGATIVLGGERLGDRRFCSTDCLFQAGPVRVAEEIPDSVVETKALELRQGACPLCGSAGPNDVYESYRISSFLVRVSTDRRTQISCRRCGLKRQLVSLGWCALFGWWSFAGLFVTPALIVGNVINILSPPNETRPSERLKKLVRKNMAAPVAEDTRSGWDA
jgi:hypothetical protein